MDVSFTVTLDNADTDPSNITGFDLYLGTAAANSGYFSLTLATPTGPFTGNGPDDTTPDSLGTAAASGFVRNANDQGFTGSPQATPGTFNLETPTISIAANTPANTYTLFTTTTPTAGAFYSDVANKSGSFEATNPGTFTITVVPEPGAGTCCLAAGALGLVAFARRRAAPVVIR